MMADSNPQIDPREFRDTLGQFPTGVVIITAIVDTEAVGMVVGSFVSVSLDPPLVAFLPTRSSSTYAKLKRASRYCVNVLSVEQESTCRQFASKTPDKFAGVDWHLSSNDLPRLSDAVAWIEFEHTTTFEAGDHDIVMGRVIDLEINFAGSPLLFFQGGYGGFRSRSRVAPFAADLREQLQLADLARDVMDELSEDLDLECYAQAIVDGDLAIVAGAGATEGVRAQIGRRLPFVPPYGAVFMAHRPREEAIQVWSTHMRPSEHSQQQQREMLERVERRGWSLGLSAPNHDEVWSEVAELAEAAPTPHTERELTVKLDQLLPFYEPSHLDSDAKYDPRILAAPVFQDHRVCSRSRCSIFRAGSPGRNWCGGQIDCRPRLLRSHVGSRACKRCPQAGARIL